MNFLVNKTAKNAFWLIGEKVFNMSISLIAISLVARYLGPESFGMINYAIALVALFSVFSTLGLDNVNIKSIVQKEAEEGIILCTSLYLRALGSLIIISFSFITIWILNIQDKTQIALILIMASVYIFKSLEVIEYWVQAYQNSRLSSTVRMIVAVISLAIKATIVWLDLGIIPLGIVYIIEVILIGFGLIVVYKKHRINLSKWLFSIEYIKLALSQSWYLIVTGLFVAVYKQLDKVLIGNLVSKEELGIYMAAISVSSLWIFIPMALINSFKPVIMNLKTENEELYLDKIQYMYSLLMLVNIVCVLIIFFLSDFIINILYGSLFESATNILTITVWAGCFSVFGTARGIWMLCEGNQKYSVFFLGIGAIFSVLMNILLIPKFGSFGAAVTILLTEILTTVITPLLFKETKIFTIMFFKAILFKNLSFKKIFQ